MNVDVLILLCSWIQVANIGTCRAGAGVAVVACHCDDLKDITKLTISGPGSSLYQTLS